MGAQFGERGGESKVRTAWNQRFDCGQAAALGRRDGARTNRKRADEGPRRDRREDGAVRRLTVKAMAVGLRKQAGLHGV